MRRLPRRLRLGYQSGARPRHLRLSSSEAAGSFETPIGFPSGTSECPTDRRRSHMVSAMPVVRPASREDLPILVAIYNHYIENSIATFDTEPVTVEDRTGWFESFSEVGPYRLFVACDRDRVLGCASSSQYRTHPAFHKTVEFGVYVDPEARTAGIGSALYRELLDTLVTEDLHLAVAGIALPNDASVALHRKFEFTDVGVFEEYAMKNGTYISSLWMQRRL